MIKQKSLSLAAAVYLFLFLSVLLVSVRSPGSEFLGEIGRQSPVHPGWRENSSLNVNCWFRTVVSNAPLKVTFKCIELV